MKRVGLTLIAVASAAFMFGFVNDGLSRETPRSTKDPLEGKPAPKLEVNSWINAKADKMDWKSLEGKVVILDFWGTWCGPCRASIPHLKELYAKYKDQGLVVIGIHTTNGAEEMEAYVKENSMPYPVAADVEGKTVKAFAIDSFPDYCVIDRKGVLRVADLANADVEKAIKLMLAEK